MDIESVNQLAQLAVGGGVVGAFWSWRNDRLAQYRYLDEVYSALLDAYRARPEFGDPAKTKEYSTAFEKNRERYHFFAMSAMNTMETIYDVLRGRPMWSKQWRNIFKFHVLLHWTWLAEHTESFEPAFVTYCKTALNR